MLDIIDALLQLLQLPDAIADMFADNEDGTPSRMRRAWRRLRHPFGNH